ncbi:MAG: hypothetical protein GY884_00900 [Proteobacteria bacterium]|nr:hypothetical protein [Pseudomonadota bacterium]
MMEKLRMGTDSFLIQALFVIIVLSFVFWGIGDSGQKSYAKAEVNGKRITDTQFDNEMRSQSRRAGRTLGDDEYREMARGVLTSMIRTQVLVSEAERLGLEVSDDEVKRYIYTIPAFQDESGTFSKALYENYLKGTGNSDVAFRATLYEGLLTQKLQQLAAMSVRITDTELDEMLSAEGSTVSVMYVKVADSAFLGDVEVTDVDVQGLLTDGEERVRATYDAQFERRFNEPRKATLRSILLRTDIDGSDPVEVAAKMELVQADLDGGMAFADAAAKWSESLTAGSGGLLGTQAEDQLDPAVADAVFAVEAGARTEVVESSRGLQVFLVEEIIEAKETPFEETKEMLAREILQEDRAPELSKAFADSLLASWTEASAPPLDLLVEKGLLPESDANVKLSADGPSGLGAAPEMMAALQDAQNGDVLPAVYEVRGQRVIAQVTSRSDLDLSEASEDRLRFADIARAQKQQEFVTGYLDDLVANADVVRNDGAEPE